jgi:hypothetical protein
MAPLGIDSSSTPPEPCSGIGGATLAHFQNISILLPGIVPYLAYASFTEGLDRWGLGLLGQTGFFDRFHVCFDMRRGFFEIET